MDCVVGVVAAVKRGGGKLARVSFSAKNGDYYGDSAVITIQGSSLESPCKAPFLARKSFRERLRVKSSFASSLRGLKNAIFSAKILESYGDSKKRAQLLESTFTQSPNFSLTILKSHIALESNLPSLRDTAEAVAWQSTSAKNAKQAMRSFFRKVDSRENAQNREALESNFEKSCDFKDNAKNVSKQPKDSRILEIESGLCELTQGRILGVCNCSTHEAIHDSSPKAESFNKPTPKRLAL